MARGVRKDRAVKSQFPNAYRITPSGPIDTAVAVPGSKSITNRALLCAALAQGQSELHNPLESDDIEAMCEGLAALGVSLGSRPTRASPWTVEGCGGRLAAPARIDARASGTTARFLCAAAALASGPVIIDGSPRMRERPIDDLGSALTGLGVTVEDLGVKGCPPVRISGYRLQGGRVTVDARRSSQFVSALLLAAPCAERAVTLDLKGPVVSRPFIELTLQVMGSFGADARWRGESSLVVSPSGYAARVFRVEPDATAASYPFAAAAIAGGRVRVEGVPGDSAQGDFAFLALLERMGCQVERTGSWVEVRRGSAPLRGVEVDMNDIPDTVLTLAVVALFAEGPTRIRNVANLRIKETDRLAALERELSKLGARARVGPDWLEVHPGPRRAATIETYDDHRMAMAFSLAGLRVEGVTIRDPQCVAKTWPRFFEAMHFLGARPV